MGRQKNPEYFPVKCSIIDSVKENFTTADGRKVLISMLPEKNRDSANFIVDKFLNELVAAGFATKKKVAKPGTRQMYYVYSLTKSKDEIIKWIQIQYKKIPEEPKEKKPEAVMKDAISKMAASWDLMKPKELVNLKKRMEQVFSILKYSYARINALGDGVISFNDSKLKLLIDRTAFGATDMETWSDLIKTETGVLIDYTFIVGDKTPCGRGRGATKAVIKNVKSTMLSLDDRYRDIFGESLDARKFLGIKETMVRVEKPITEVSEKPKTTEVVETPTVLKQPAKIAQAKSVEEKKEKKLPEGKLNPDLVFLVGGLIRQANQSLSLDYICMELRNRNLVKNIVRADLVDMVHRVPELELVKNNESVKLKDANSWPMIKESYGPEKNTYLISVIVKIDMPKEDILDILHLSEERVENIEGNVWMITINRNSRCEFVRFVNLCCQFRRDERVVIQGPYIKEFVDEIHNYILARNKAMYDKDIRHQLEMLD